VVTKPAALASIFAFESLMSAPLDVAVPCEVADAITSLVSASYTLMPLIILSELLVPV